MNKKILIIFMLTFMLSEMTVSAAEVVASDVNNGDAGNNGDCCPQPRPACCPVKKCFKRVCSPRPCRKVGCRPKICLGRYYRGACRPKPICCPRIHCCRPKPGCCPQPAPVCPELPCVQPNANGDIRPTPVNGPIDIQDTNEIPDDQDDLTAQRAEENLNEFDSGVEDFQEAK